MSAPVFSQSADKLLIDEIRCASIALDASFASSDDQTFVVIILSLGIQLI